jgi:hypothetical protein
VTVDSDRFVTSSDSREGEISGSDRFVAATDSLQFSSRESESVVFARDSWGGVRGRL